MNASTKTSKRVEGATLAPRRKAAGPLPPERELASRLLPLLERIAQITHLWRTKESVLYEDVKALCRAEDAFYCPERGEGHA